VPGPNGRRHQEVRRFGTIAAGAPLFVACSSKSLSDLNGTDPYIHGGRPEGVTRAPANALARISHRPAMAQLRAIHLDLRPAAFAIKLDPHTGELLEARGSGSRSVPPSRQRSTLTNP